MSRKHENIPRFWFENGNDEASRFRIAQLDSLRDTSMARVICDNTDIEEVQPLAFRVEDNRLLFSRIFFPFLYF